MIVVTGATGNVGAPTVELLRGQGQQVRGLSRHPSHPDDRAVDLADADAVNAAVAGADAVFAIVPAVENQLDMERNLIAAARAAGVTRSTDSSFRRSRCRTLSGSRAPGRPRRTGCGP